MNRLEKTITKYESNINFIYKSDMPNGLGALTVGNTVLINNHYDQISQLQNVVEEIGHVKTTAGNISGYETINDIRQEKQARIYGSHLIIDLDSIIACYKANITTPWEMAEFFEVSESYMWKAIDSYRIKRGISFDYKGYRFNLNNGLSMSKI